MHLGIIKITYNRTAQPRCYHNAFYGRLFLKHRRECNSDFAMTIWPFWISNWLCFVISLSICYWLFKCGVLHSVCVCECESVCVCVCVCVCACVWDKERGSQSSVVCVCVCVWERGRQGHTTAACVQTHTSIITVSVTGLCSLLGLNWC